MARKEASETWKEKFKYNNSNPWMNTRFVRVKIYNEVEYMDNVIEERQENIDKINKIMNNIRDIAVGALQPHRDRGRSRPGRLLHRDPGLPQLPALIGADPRELDARPRLERWDPLVHPDSLPAAVAGPIRARRTSSRSEGRGPGSLEPSPPGHRRVRPDRASPSPSRPASRGCRRDAEPGPPRR